MGTASVGTWLADVQGSLVMSRSELLEEYRRQMHHAPAHAEDDGVDHNELLHGSMIHLEFYQQIVKTSFIGLVRGEMSIILLTS